MIIKFVIVSNKITHFKKTGRFQTFSQGGIGPIWEMGENGERSEACFCQNNQEVHHTTKAIICVYCKRFFKS